MTFRTLSLAAMLSVVVAVAGFGQGPGTGRIRGAVRAVDADANQQIPVAGATVSIIDSPDSVVTDEDGHFFLGPIAAGKYDLEARRIGYTPYRVSVQVSPNRTTDVLARMT